MPRPLAPEAEAARGTDVNYKSLALYGLLASACYWSKDPNERGTSSTGQTPAQTDQTPSDQKTPASQDGQKPKDTVRDPVGTPTSKAKVFATRATYKGNFGGLVGADAKCMQAAPNAGFSGRFVAFLSTSSQSAASRITSNGPWVNTKGEELFGASASAWTGFPKVPIRYDESGQMQMPGYWTGSAQGSIAAPETCNNWSEDRAEGQTGTPSWSDKLWVTAALSTPCDFEHGLLCVELR